MACTRISTTKTFRDQSFTGVRWPSLASARPALPRSPDPAVDPAPRWTRPQCPLSANHAGLDSSPQRPRPFLLQPPVSIPLHRASPSPALPSLRPLVVPAPSSSPAPSRSLREIGPGHLSAPVALPHVAKATVAYSSPSSSRHKSEPSPQGHPRPLPPLAHARPTPVIPFS